MYITYINNNLKYEHTALYNADIYNMIYKTSFYQKRSQINRLIV